MFTTEDRWENARKERSGHATAPRYNGKWDIAPVAKFFEFNKPICKFDRSAPVRACEGGRKPWPQTDEIMN